ncbi:MAG: 5'/3'-nucleotidase SurE [Acholeplasmataceae bacterium]|nr:5'/3'-nucleotidase SurE [Acholeplasmataceae bacterium]
MKRMILVTNDDGYNSLGIRLLTQKIANYGNLTIVAPHRQMSGASVSRVSWNETVVHKHADNVFSVDGTPADTVSFALHGLKLKPDFVVSGINNGFNIGADTVYSGTVGACLEALKYGFPAIAFSADYNHFDPADKEFEKVMDLILGKGLLSSDYLLNVNFVSRNYSQSKGIMITDLGFRDDGDYYVRLEAGIYQNRRRFSKVLPKPETDIWAELNGYISITPLKFANQSPEGLRELREKVSRIE